MKPGTVPVMIPNRINARPSSTFLRRAMWLVSTIACLLVGNATVFGQTHGTTSHQGGGEANLQIPNLSQVKFMGIDGHTLLLFGLIVSVLGLLFGMAIYSHLKSLPVHSAMREVSELI